MKKIVFVLLIIMGVVLSGGTVSAKRELGKGAYINENGVKIFKKDYEKFVTLGFVDREILQFTQEQYDNYLEKHIDYVEKVKYYIETETKEENGELVTHQKLMNEHEFYHEYNQSLIKPESNEFSIMSTSESASAISGFMVLTVTATYDSCKGPTGEVFVKANLEWTSEPSQRYFDLLGITYSPNVYLKQFSNNGINYPDFLTKMFYTTHTITFNPLTLGYDETFEQRSVLITPYDNSYYKKSSNYLISGVNLPVDDNLHGYYKQVNYDFLITTECTLIPYSTSLSLAEIGAVYTHQYGHGSFEWNRANISLENPYFTYNNSILINNPAYMDPVVGLIEFSDLVSGHQFVVNHYNDTYHYFECSECGYLYQEEHVLIDNHCSSCDYSGHDHDYVYNSNGKASHTATCATCEVFIIEPHTFVYEHNQLMHFVVCQDCGFKKSQMKHIFLLNGGKTCIECGYTKK